MKPVIAVGAIIGFVLSILYICLKYVQTLEMLVGDSMNDKLSIAMFGQKRLSREGGIEIVVKELCTRMAQKGHRVTCYNILGHHVSGAEYDDQNEYEGICQKYVPTIEKKGLAAVSSSLFAALYSAFGRYDVVHIHVECEIMELTGKNPVKSRLQEDSDFYPKSNIEYGRTIKYSSYLSGLFNMLLATMTMWRVFFWFKNPPNRMIT